MKKQLIIINLSIFFTAFCSNLYAEKLTPSKKPARHSWHKKTRKMGDFRSPGGKTLYDGVDGTAITPGAPVHFDHFNWAREVQRAARTTGLAQQTTRGWTLGPRRYNEGIRPTRAHHNLRRTQDTPLKTFEAQTLNAMLHARGVFLEMSELQREVEGYFEEMGYTDSTLSSDIDITILRDRIITAQRGAGGGEASAVAAAAAASTATLATMHTGIRAQLAPVSSRRTSARRSITRDLSCPQPTARAGDAAATAEGVREDS